MNQKNRRLPGGGFSPMIEHFGLDRSVVFLNHGSFGAVPRVIVDRHRALMDRVEREPVRFFVEELEGLLDASRERVAAFVRFPADDLAFVTNATEGVNTVLRSLDLRAGDRVVSGTHEYNACNNAAEYVCRRAGAELVRVPMACPVVSVEAIVNSVMSAVNERTKLVMVSHITSPSGLIMPVEAIVQACAARGVDVLVDGACAGVSHARYPRNRGGVLHRQPSQVVLCAEGERALLYVRPDRQERVKPVTISHGENSKRTDRSRYRLNFDMVGSRDYGPWVLAPEAIDFVGALGGTDGWAGVRKRMYALAAEGGRLITEALRPWGTRTLGPESMLGAMRAYTLPTPRGGVVGETKYNDPLQDRLLERWGIQVPVHTVPTAGGGQRVVRLSAMVYNSDDQYAYLGEALAAELKAEGC